MKLRLGFISNSSASSFVIMGYKIKRSKKLEKLLDSKEIKNFDIWDYDDNFMYAGAILVNTVVDNGPDTPDVPLKGALKKCEAAKAFFDIGDKDKKEIKVYSFISLG